MSELPPGPPSPPRTGPVGPPPPRVAPPFEAPEPPGPRLSVPKVVLAGAAAFLLCFGLGLGFVLAGDDGGDDADRDQASSDGATADAGGGGDEPSSPFFPGGPDDQGDDAPTDTLPIPDDPFGDLPDDLPDGADGLDDLLDQLPEGFEDLLPDDLLDQLEGLEDLDDLEGLPDQLGDIQVTIAFTDDAAPRRMERIRDAFEDSDLLSFVQYVTAEQLEDLAGGPLPFAIDTLSAFSREGAQAGRVRDFVCGFADDPAVRIVQIFGAEPCDQSL